MFSIQKFNRVSSMGKWPIFSSLIRSSSTSIVPYSEIPLQDIALTEVVKRRLPDLMVYGKYLSLTKRVTPLAATTDNLLSHYAAWENKSKQDLRSDPNIAAAIQFNNLIGVDNNKYPPSVLNLIQRYILKSRPLPTIHPIVDSVNLAVVTSLIPLGVFDAQNVQGKLLLSYTQGDEKFQPLGSAQIEQLPKDILVLRDDKQVLSRFACRDGEKQKIITNTTRIWLLGCQLPGMQKSAVVSAMNSALSHLNNYYTMDVAINASPTTEQFQSNKI